MKYLRTFETRADYKSAKKAHTLEVPNVSLVKQDYAVYIMPTFATKESAEAGDIIVYSKAAYTAWTEAEAGSAKNAAYETLLGSVRYMKPEHFNADSAKLYVPEAIVAVPYSHTGDGTVRAMSLRHMSAADPENGSTGNTTIVWGAYVDFSGITNHTGCAVVSNVALGDKSTLTSANPTYLPSDTLTALEVINSDSEYYWNSATGKHAPCPYKADGSLNRQYLGEWGTNGSKLTNNCLGDMNGASNTEKIIDTLSKAYLDQTLFAATITNDRTKAVYGLGDKTVHVGESYKINAAGDTETAVATSEMLEQRTVQVGEKYVDAYGVQQKAVAPEETPEATNVTVTAIKAKTAPLNAGDTYKDVHGDTVTVTGISGKPVFVTDILDDEMTVQAWVSKGNTNIFPAAMCCQRYKTVLKPNTVTYDSANDKYTYGDWYLPSAGEVGYTIVNKGRISYALSRINAALPGTAAAWVDGWLWSSSEYNNNYAWHLYTSSGNVDNYGSKNLSFMVRAFAAF